MQVQDLIAQLQSANRQSEVNLAFQHPDGSYQWYELQAVDRSFEKAFPNKPALILLQAGELSGDG